MRLGGFAVCAELTHVAIVKSPRDARLHYFFWRRSICVIHVVIEEQQQQQQRGCLPTKRWAIFFPSVRILFGSAWKITCKNAVSGCFCAVSYDPSLYCIVV